MIADPLVGKLYTLLKRTLPHDTHPDHYLFAGTQHAFYKLFKDGLKWLGVSEHGFQVYSVRRGGATSFFRKTRNMEATLDRGRWSSARVARIYVNDGLAKQVELNFDTAVKARLNTLAGALSIWLKQNWFSAYGTALCICVINTIRVWRRRLSAGRDKGVLSGVRRLLWLCALRVDPPWSTVVAIARLRVPPVSCGFRLLWFCALRVDPPWSTVVAISRWQMFPWTLAIPSFSEMSLSALTRPSTFGPLSR